MKTCIRIVAVMITIYLMRSIILINDFSVATQEVNKSSSNIWNTFINKDTINNPDIELQEVVSKDFIKKFSNFIDSMLSFRSLPTLITGIIIGVYFIIDPLAVYLRDFIKNFFEIFL